MIVDRLIGWYLRQVSRRHLSFEPVDTRTGLPAAAAARSYLLYLHVPFCVVLCPFCSFHRVRFKQERAERYFQALEREAPERLEVPSGSRIALAYEPGRPPVLAVRIQELFGLAETPRVAGGRVAVLLHLLGPNFRPQQVTDDLASFWRNTYPQVRRELKRRYPKHSWPDDPLSAEPLRGARRRR